MLFFSELSVEIYRVPKLPPPAPPPHPDRPLPASASASALKRIFELAMPIYDWLYKFTVIYKISPLSTRRMGQFSKEKRAFCWSIFLLVCVRWLEAASAYWILGRHDVFSAVCGIYIDNWMNKKLADYIICFTYDECWWDDSCLPIYSRLHGCSLEMAGICIWTCSIAS